MIRSDQITLSSTPATPVDSPRLGTSRNLTLPSAEGGQDFALLALGHLEVIKGEAKFRGDFVEHPGRDLQVEMRVAQLPGCVRKWPARHRDNPQRPQELQARQPSRVDNVSPTQLERRVSCVGDTQNAGAAAGRLSAWRPAIRR